MFIINFLTYTWCRTTCLRDNLIFSIDFKPGIAGICLLKVNNRNTKEKVRNMFKVNNKATKTTPGFIVNFEHISHLCSGVSIVKFEHVIARGIIVWFYEKENGWKIEQSYLQNPFQYYYIYQNVLGIKYIFKVNYKNGPLMSLMFCWTCWTQS